MIKKDLNKVILCLAVLGMLAGCEDLLENGLFDDERDRLVDTWKCNESEVYLKSALSVYRVDIEKHRADSARILIYNFFDLGDDVAAEAVLSGNVLSLPNQTLEGGFTFHGSGQVSRDASSIDWIYYLDDGSGKEVVITAEYTRL